MPEMRFYHLTRGKPEDALAQILEKAYDRGMTSFVLCDDKAVAARLDRYLWTFRADSFLPHARQDDKNAPEENPITLGYDPASTGKADFLVLFGHEEPDDMERYALVAAVFEERNDQAKLTARERWKAMQKKEGWDLTYWQQDEAGRWQKR